MNDNTAIYLNLLKQLFVNPCEMNKSGISYELLCAQAEFKPLEHIEGSAEKYIQAELDWYDSQDLCIKGHKFIEDNKVWQNCATEYGLVNSNYGWCIYSDQNYNQFENAVRSLAMDKHSKQAVMVYTRPQIHEHAFDGKHAAHDMICTCYTSSMIRKDKLIHMVHMRSNDVWFGLRNDLAWQQAVQKRLYERLREQYKNLILGPVIWNADSLHLYSKSYPAVRKYYLEHYPEAQNDITD